MMASPKVNETVCREFGGALRDAPQDLRSVAGLLKRILREEMWRDREVRDGVGRVQFDRFEDFVTTPPLRGIGGDLNMIRRLIGDDMEAVDLLDRTVQNKRGGGRNQHTDCQLDNIQEAPCGTSRAASLRRLRKDAPEIHARVLAGELSPHAGMIEAGFRKKHTPLEAAKKAVMRLNDEELSDFAEWYAAGMES